MPEKPTYDQLVQRVRELEREAAGRPRTDIATQDRSQVFPMFLDQADLLSSLHDKSGTCLMINPKLAGLLGGRTDDFVGQPLSMIYPENTPSYERRILEVITHGRSLRFEQGVRFAGEKRWLLSLAHPVTDAVGDPSTCHILAVDITERKQAEDRVLHFKTAVDLSSDAIGMATPEGRHWYQNHAFDQLFGTIGDDPPASLYVDEKIGREVFRTIMDGCHWRGEVEMRAKDGTILNILLRAYAIKGEGGQVVGLVGTHTDISDRKRAETALREREERLRTILVANPDPMVIYDTEGVPQYLNPAFTEVFGWSLTELKGRRIPFVPDDQKETTAARIRRVFASRSTTRFETKRLTKDGRTLDVIVSAAMIRRPDGLPAGMTVNLTDVSQRKSLQAQYEQAQRMESLGTLAGGIAHDFNNLLMGIQGRASLMAMDLSPDHPFYEHLRGIEAYVNSASDLTRQLLGFARGGKYEVKPLDLNELVQSSAEMFGRTRKEIRIGLALQPSLQAVEADRRQIEQVLLNIYVNAWQAMPQGGQLTIATKTVRLDETFCSPHQAKAGQFVSIAIADTGIGMDPAIQNRIFDPFFTTKEKSRGTGLGLASAFGIIKNHGGIITVASEPGRGATFTIYLPASQKQVDREAALVKTVVKGSERILLVDDEELVIVVGQSMLEKIGYQVICAGSGEAAMEILTRMKDQVDLVILDLIMPGLDGGRTFEQIRTLDPTMRVLLSSGYALDGQAEALLQKGCNGFIQKPFTIQELSKKIRAVLDEPDSFG